MAIYVNFKEMDDASFELNSIKEKFLTEMDALEQIVNETTINDWKGSDANTFVSLTKQKISKLRNDYDEYLTDINNEIIRNSQKFEDTQKRNLNMINNDR